MDVYNEKFFDKLISQISDLLTDIEKNAYEFDPNSDEANFWHDLSDEMRIIVDKLEAIRLQHELPF